MKICVFGAGAVGGMIAAYLARRGEHEVSAVLRGQRLAQVERNGFAVEVSGETLRAPARAVADASALGVQDIAIITLKAPSIPGAVAAIKPLLGPHTAVVCVMNGIPWWYGYQHGGAHDGRRFACLDPEGRVWDGIGPQRVIGGVAYCSAAVLLDGTVRIDYPEFKFEFGEPDRSQSARLRTLVDLLNDAGVHSSMTTDIRQRIWAKLVQNISSGPGAVLTQSPLCDVFAVGSFATVATHMMEEAAAIARADGIKLDINTGASIGKMSKSGHKPSILQDLEAGRPMEIDGLYTVPLEMARSLGVATPTLDILIGLARLRARAAGLY